MSNLASTTSAMAMPSLVQNFEAQKPDAIAKHICDLQEQGFEVTRVVPFIAFHTPRGDFQQQTAMVQIYATKSDPRPETLEDLIAGTNGGEPAPYARVICPSV